MGLGQFTTALLKIEHYLSEEARKKKVIESKPEEEAVEIHEFLGQYGVSHSGARTLYLRVRLDGDAGSMAAHTN
jgi:hypothetical protein